MENKIGVGIGAVMGIVGLFLIFKKSGGAPPPPSITISGFHYVYQGTYTWILADSMIHGQDITHIGFSFRNNGVLAIPNVSLAARVEWENYNVIILGESDPRSGASIVLSPPLDQYLNIIAQPFTLELENRGVWFDFVLPAELHEIELFSGIFQWQGPPKCKLTAEVWVGEELAKSQAIEFNVSYD